MSDLRHTVAGLTRVPRLLKIEQRARDKKLDPREQYRSQQYPPVNAENLRAMNIRYKPRR